MLTRRHGDAGKGRDRAVFAYCFSPRRRVPASVAQPVGLRPRTASAYNKGGILSTRPGRKKMRGRSLVHFAAIVAGACLVSPLSAADRDKPAVGKQGGDAPIPLNPAGTVLLDKAGKRLLVKTRIVLREGSLEMLCCPAQTKEHESILATDAQAYVIHTGLLALGAVPGTPVQYQPKFVPPSGQPIDIFLQWTDDAGKPHRVRAQEWIRYSTHRIFAVPMERLPAGLSLPERNEELPIRYFPKFKELTWMGPMTAAQREKLLRMSGDLGYQKAIRTFFEQGQSRQLDAGWVFAGSGYYVDEQTGRKSYLAEGGDLICVSNFPTAMLDLAVKSTNQNDEGLLFEPWTERVPRKGTPVLMELVPVFAKAAGK
jgi:hypothetical protein